ncbi:hypothetical protein [Jannaschia seohaensis]|uniref:Uncharacterized protein n=1 Tax=Jannaschia seohaensis TaxID=475081 RepID=A0A2Y9B4J9_9RHOB|nr:hypothetical protein [Jannaschia seohaensis]PWJ12444.1 hypothetical protein BCF38_1162 [Jannaschia seohaensis]SSA50925.1 hypothetical protein SAMN05421539_1162 [Jannaschia seohaensis]
MKPAPQISPIWIVALAALALASLGLDSQRPMVADLDLPQAQTAD